MKLAWTFALLVTSFLLLVPDAKAQCTEAGLWVITPLVLPGGTVVLNGDQFKPCTNTGPVIKDPLPIKKIKIVFVQGNRKTKIGYVDADQYYEIFGQLRIPEDAQAGPAAIVAEYTVNQLYSSTRRVAFDVFIPSLR